MKARAFGLLDVLDEGVEAVAAVAAPFLGVLWLTAVPLRLAQAHFLFQVGQLGADAGRHGNYLTELALVQVAFLLPWAWGRAVFVRACRFGLEGRRPGRAALSVGALPFAGYLYVTALLEAVAWATAWTVVALPAVVLLGALAAATHAFIERPGLIDPLRQLFRHGRQAFLLAGLLMVMGWALLVAGVNLHVLYQGGMWLAGALPGTEPGRWRAIVDVHNPRYWLVLVCGAVLAVEPYLLGAVTVYVHKLRARSTGEDLRLWFERLRRAEAA